MTFFYMQKMPGGMLAPSDEEAELAMRRFKLAEPVRVSVKRIRNYEFHKKFFALVNYAYEFWEPAPLPDSPEHRWRKKVTPEKNMDRFRKDLTILAGWYDAHYRVNGEVRIEAKSISFAAMDDDEFEKLYSATIDVILKHVCTQMTEERLRDIVDDILRFAA